MADWKGIADTWLSIVGGVAGIAGIALGFASWRVGVRSAKAARDAAHSAAESAEEARTISQIEKRRVHVELTPSRIEVAYFWRPTPTTGGVFAEVTNGSTCDYEIEPVLVDEAGGTAALPGATLLAGWTERIFIASLVVPSLSSDPETWDDRRKSLPRSAMAALEAAVRGSRHRFGRLELHYRCPKGCPCAERPPGDAYGHWTTRHAIEHVQLAGGKFRSRGPSSNPSA